MGNLLIIMLFGPGIRFVPEVVWRSKFFWIALVVVIAGILIFHNLPFKKNDSMR